MPDSHSDELLLRYLGHSDSAATGHFVLDIGGSNTSRSTTSGGATTSSIFGRQFNNLQLPARSIANDAHSFREQGEGGGGGSGGGGGMVHTSSVPRPYHNAPSHTSSATMWSYADVRLTDMGGGPFNAQSVTSEGTRASNFELAHTPSTSLSIQFPHLFEPRSTAARSPTTTTSPNTTSSHQLNTPSPTTSKPLLRRRIDRSSKYARKDPELEEVEGKTPKELAKLQFRLSLNRKIRQRMAEKEDSVNGSSGHRQQTASSKPQRPFSGKYSTKKPSKPAAATHSQHAARASAPTASSARKELPALGALAATTMPNSESSLLACFESESSPRYTPSVIATSSSLSSIPPTSPSYTRPYTPMAWPPTDSTSAITAVTSTVATMNNKELSPSLPYEHFNLSQFFHPNVFPGQFYPTMSSMQHEPQYGGGGSSSANPHYDDLDVSFEGFQPDPKLSEASQCPCEDHQVPPPTAVQVHDFFQGSRKGKEPCYYSGGIGDDHHHASSRYHSPERAPSSLSQYTLTSQTSLLSSSLSPLSSHHNAPGSIGTMGHPPVTSIDCLFYSREPLPLLSPLPTFHGGESHHHDHGDVLLAPAAPLPQPHLPQHQQHHHQQQQPHQQQSHIATDVQRCFTIGRSAGSDSGQQAAANDAPAYTAAPSLPRPNGSLSAAQLRLACGARTANEFDREAAAVGGAGPDNASAHGPAAAPDFVSAHGYAQLQRRPHPMALHTLGAQPPPPPPPPAHNTNTATAAAATSAAATAPALRIPSFSELFRTASLASLLGQSSVADAGFDGGGSGGSVQGQGQGAAVSVFGQSASSATLMDYMMPPLSAPMHMQMAMHGEASPVTASAPVEVSAMDATMYCYQEQKSLGRDAPYPLQPGRDAARFFLSSMGSSATLLGLLAGSRSNSFSEDLGGANSDGKERDGAAKHDGALVRKESALLSRSASFLAELKLFDFL
ncbi:hypothetical protein DFJ73DRAFT_793159 [Zopfochytrium polystomum]|nr:hypothetical protein DFJ73DRAFT_793159 [Zopfochytrium polystomum]